MLITVTSSGGTLMKLTVTGYFHGSLVRFDFFDVDNGSQQRLTGYPHPAVVVAAVGLRGLGRLTGCRPVAVTAYQFTGDAPLCHSDSPSVAIALYRKKRSRSGRPNLTRHSGLR